MRFRAESTGLALRTGTTDPVITPAGSVARCGQVTLCPAGRRDEAASLVKNSCGASPLEVFDVLPSLPRTRGPRRSACEFPSLGGVGRGRARGRGAPLA